MKFKFLVTVTVNPMDKQDKNDFEKNDGKQ
jgi:hypothetical protein